MNRTSTFFLLAVISASLPLTASAAEPEKANSSHPGSDAVAPDRETAAASRFAKFVAEAGQEPPEALAAWKDYQRVVGTGKPARQLFAEMVQSEPELCSAVGGDKKKLNELFAKRLAGVLESVATTRLLRDRRQGIWVEIAPGETGAILFLAAHRDIALNATVDDQIQKMLMEDMIARMREKDRSYTEVRELLMKWMTQWACRDDDIPGFMTRWNVARTFRLNDATETLAVQVLRYPEATRHPGSHYLEDLAIEFGIATVGKLGERKDIPLLTRFLVETRRIFSCPEQEDSQLRDMALGGIVKLSGGRPEDYKLEPSDAVSMFGGRTRVYLFASAEARNAGFARCVAHFKELGLDAPPNFTPERVPLFLFEPIKPELAKKLATRQMSPDGKVTLELRGNTARLIDVGTGKQIGKDLQAGTWGTPNNQFTFACWSFSPDGKSVATGAGFFRKDAGSDGPDNIGHVQVWDAATGSLLEINKHASGRVHTVGFGDDGKTIHYEAEPPQRDIS